MGERGTSTVTRDAHTQSSVKILKVEGGASPCKVTVGTDDPENQRENHEPACDVHVKSLPSEKRTTCNIFKPCT